MIRGLTDRRGKVGGSYYDPISCKLYVLDDSQESAHYELTQMRTLLLLDPSILQTYFSTVVEQIEPDIVLVSSKTEDGCMEVLRKHGNVFKYILRRIYPRIFT